MQNSILRLENTSKKLNEALIASKKMKADKD
jgi:hypothetical protein